jgi:hypothetical protein
VLATPDRYRGAGQGGADCYTELRRILLRACANRRVAYVARSSKKAIESLLPLSSTKSCQPIGAASYAKFAEFLFHDVREQAPAQQANVYCTKEPESLVGRDPGVLPASTSVALSKRVYSPSES